MSVNLSPLGGAGWQFFDNSGNVLSGGQLYTYSAGTTTPLTTYSEATGQNANANPIVLDSAGRVSGEVWLTSNVAYKFVLKTSTGTTLWTCDSISAVPRVANTGIPTTGLWNQGDIIWNSAPTSGGYAGWICTVSGTPGTWKTFGLIS